MKIINLLKKIYVYMRTTVKFLSLAVVGAVIIVAAIVLVYKPIYKVTVNGEKLGYCEDKDALQNKINDYMEQGDGQANVAFVQIDDMPDYQICLLKKGITTNDDEIFESIKATGITYYRFYAIADDNKEKVYIDSFEKAENIIVSLKSKDSKNKDDLTIVEKYETQLPELTTEEKAISTLYEKKVVVATTRYSSKGSSKVSTSRALNYNKVNLGITLIKPLSGVLTSRYGYRWGRTHTGIDIGASKGTNIKAAAGGTVTFSGWKGSLGNLVVISHGNGIQTYYGHCSKLLVSAGQTVSAGQVIAKVGSTGHSTGNHLHFEIRINGSSINPQSYIGY